MAMSLVAALELRSVDLQISRNNKEHHTQEMGRKRLITRRGQAFTFQMFFSRPFQSQTDHIIFMAETAASNSLQVTLFTPANAVIGYYTLKIEIIQGQGPSATYPVGTFILLFNPWSTEDDVYLPSEILLQEYIMKDYGFVYKGHEKFITSWPWNFGQAWASEFSGHFCFSFFSHKITWKFEEDIIDICFEILNKSLYFLNNWSKDYSRRNDVVYVCRVVSAMINSNDDNGVLQGNWGEDYSRGVSPLEWNGSVAILRQWSASGGQPVKYGQCWVFASVMCTVMRCLGVPTRVVSNFRSAHNVDGNLTIDTYYHRDAEMLPTQKRDKIWNFHVWNECWMIRRDLPPGYNGWQVLDPTPQQTSSGLFCCGPASVKAIREGEVHLAYDTPFVFAEVNADEVIWLFEEGQAQEILAHNTSSIGKEISTKMVGSDQRQDITSSYKNFHVWNECWMIRRDLPPGYNGWQVLDPTPQQTSSGSPEERSVFMKASRKMLDPKRSSSSFLDLLGSGSTEDRPAQLQLHLTKVPEWGQDLLLMLHVRRVPDRVHPRGPIRLAVHFCAQALLHGGSAREPLWRQTVHLSLDFGEETRWPLLLPYNSYRNRLTDEKRIRVSGIARVEETGKYMLVLKDISLEPPHLSIEGGHQGVLEEVTLCGGGIGEHCVEKQGGRSPEERSVFMKASRKMLDPKRSSSSFLDLLGSGSTEDRPAQLQLHLTKVPEWGQDLLLMLHVRRVPDRVHPRGPIRLAVHFCAQALLHGGSAREPLWRQTVHLSLDFGEETRWPLLLPYNSYRNRLTDEKLIRVSGIARVEETGKYMLVLKDISLEPPHLSIEVSERAEVGKALRVHITLTNTLMVALSNCKMVLEGSGLISGQITHDLGTLVAEHTIQIHLDLYPVKAGPRQLQVLISCNEIKEIKGYKDILVAAPRAS
ncbi:Protein-glutamine gamma-glutamyltransferase Z [Tupaia chinensis]|uniref:protein-glutamine gamma-glutamyltransferase n=1 Tax=Tupaia chinensis TaxID=246437 RepID=L9JGG1_TUPCH|nr:Protein-glutamine gamma-glutamyltransferase Z [Tupaia chinensis]